jgi:hypothetical protein
MLRAIHRVPQDVGRGRVLAGNAYLLPCEIPTPESSCAAGCTEARPPDHGQMKVWSDAAKRCGSTGVGLRLPSLNGSSGPRRNADSKRICAFSRIYSHAPNHSAPANSMARVPHPRGRGVFFCQNNSCRGSRVGERIKSSLSSLDKAAPRSLRAVCSRSARPNPRGAWGPSSSEGEP